MSTKIGLIGDVHAYPDSLEEAILLLKKHGVDLMLCTGDIAGYGTKLKETVELLKKYNCQTIKGNHDRSHLEDIPDDQHTVADIWLAQLPTSLEFTIDGILIYLVHSRPPDHDRHGIKLLDMHGELIPEQVKIWTEELKNFHSNVLIVGHSHQVYAQQLGSVLVINPGSTCFNHACGILTLPEMKVKFLPLPGHSIVRSWNWGCYEVEPDAYK